MRKAINFDIDTKKYEKYTGKKPSTAYAEIKNIFKRNGFKHRQGSGYVSKGNLIENDVIALITNTTMTLDWFRYSIKKIDVTNIGKQYDLINVINTVPNDINNFFSGTNS